MVELLGGKRVWTFPALLGVAMGNHRLADCRV